jgi:imidazolonepropionase-like amidohydrolase
VRKSLGLIGGIIVGIAMTFARAATPAAQTAPRAIVIAGGTLIDGSGAPARPNDGLLLEGGRIRTVGARALKDAPPDSLRIDATGRWILPGLIDGHIHLFQSGGLYARPDVVPAPLPAGRTYRDLVGEIRKAPEPYLRAYLCAGITSVVDFGGPRWEFELRARADADPRLPRMAFTGPLLMTGNGRDAPRVGAGPPVLALEDGDPFWPLGSQEEARQQIQRLVPHRPDIVKIVFMPRAEPDDLAARTAILRAAIAAAHEAKVRVAVHATTFDAAAAAVEAGADILVHSVADRDVDDGFVKAVVSRKVLVSPTLVVGANYREALSGAVTFEDVERKCGESTTVASFDILPSLNIKGSRPDALPIQKRNLKRLADAGAMIYASSDAGNTRTVHGPSLHRELALMADAGLRPMDILVAATKTNARLMGRENELGQIAPGMLADVVLLDADPLSDIRNTRRVHRVIRGGQLYQP